jgi:vacuolar-type H+-ATPase subunit E/Vma4
MDTEPGSGALIGAIDERADEERARLIAEAQASAARILADADAECGRLNAEALAALEKELASDQQRLLGEARMRARAEGLGRRRAIVAEAFHRAAEEISRRRNGPGGAAASAALAEEARAAVGEPCSVEAPGDGTVRAVSQDGRRSVENGLDRRLKRAESAMEHEVSRRLFGMSE